MRHLFAVSFALAVAGCLPDVRRPEGPLDSALLRPAAPSGDTVFVDSALIERPADDPFVHGELWDGCNEQALGLERAALLEENGLRVARMPGPLPARLQAVLNSRRSTTGPRRQRARPGVAVSVAVGPRRPHAAFAVRTADPRDVILSDTQAQIEVVPVLDEDGRLSLRLTPQVKYGSARARPRVEETPEGSLRWALDTREPVESLTELSIDLPMEPGEYLLIGPRGDDPRAVGPVFFAHSNEGGVPLRQLLIVRALPVGQDQDADAEDGRTAPLALQASYSSARASRR